MINDSTVFPSGETKEPFQPEGKTTTLDNVKNKIADRLAEFAGTLDEKAAAQGDQSGMAQYGKQASDWLNESAEYVRQFDPEQADAAARAYIRQNPGRSLLIAGGIGLIIGAALKRR